MAAHEYVLTLVVLLGLPTVAFLQTLSVDYGYRGASWLIAKQNATRAAVGTFVLVGAVLLLGGALR